MGLNPADYEGRFLGKDIYVLGSGPSLNHIPASFWAGKIIVSANHGCTRLGIIPTALVTKYHHHALDYLTDYPGIPVVTTRHDTGCYPMPVLDDPQLIIVDHNDNTCESWSGQWPAPGGIVATWSTITTAMHWAAHLGARNIILAGHDCGWIDEVGRIPEYHIGVGGTIVDDEDSPLWAGFNRQSRIVKAELVARYGCTVTSVNPFINLHLEGHTFH